MNRRRAIPVTLLLAGMAAPACALILGAEDLPEAPPLAMDGGGDAAPDAGAADVEDAPDLVDADDAEAHADVDADHADADADAAPMPGPCDCPSTEAWTKVFAVGAGGDVTVAGVAIDSQGHVVVAGSVAGALDVEGQVLPGAGADHDVFVLALGPCGERLWARRFGDASEQRALGLAIEPPGSPHPDAIVLTGAYAGTLSFGGAAGALTAAGQRAFVARLDPATGDGLASLGAGSDATLSYQGTAVAVTGDGAAFWAGTEGSEAALFVRRLDPSLAVTQQITPACSHCEPSLALSPSGVVVAGGFQGSVDFAPGGPGPLGSSGGSDVYVASLTPQAAGFIEVKTRSFGDQASQAASAAVTDPAGDVFVAGGFAGTLSLGGGGGTRTSTGGLDVFVARFDDKLAAQWSSTFGGAADQRATALALGGSLAVVGDFAGTLDLGADGGAPLQSAGGADVFLLALDPVTGGVRHAESFGGAGADHGAGVALDATSHAVVAGVLSGQASFACGTLGGGGASVFVARRPIP